LEPVTFGPADDPRAWARCANLIAARIATGQYPDGAWLPTGGALAAELRVSGGIVNFALRALQGKGLISRVNRTGYYAGTGGQPGGRPPRQGHGKATQGPQPGSQVPALLKREYLTAGELAASLRVTPMTIYRAIREGDISGAIRVGKNIIRIPVGSAEEYVGKCRIDGQQLNLDELDDE
jgi:excisionase family DNA binding protein